jgi:hypothetical protein
MLTASVHLSQSTTILKRRNGSQHLPWLVFPRANGKSNEHVMHRVLRCGSWWFRKQLSAVPGPNFASHLLALVLGQASQMESCMRSSIALVASFFVVISSSVSDARPSRPSVNVSECNVTMPCDFSSPQIRRGRIASYPREQHGFEQRLTSHRNAMAEVNDGRAQVVGGRPAGCPRSFCGCGASIRVFGHIVPGLNLAANWLRFPRTAPAPGMVAARRGHVFVLEQHVDGDTWMAYDANSGGHATRLHARSLRGYAVVNPRGA